MGNNVVVFWLLLSPALLKCHDIKINKKLEVEADEVGGVIQLAMRSRKAGTGFPLSSRPTIRRPRGRTVCPGACPREGVRASSGPWGITAACSHTSKARHDVTAGASTVTVYMHVIGPLNLRDLTPLSPAGKLPPINLPLPKVKVCTWTFTLEQL